MKNIVVFDLETTGTDKTKDHIIQIAALKIDRETNAVLDEMNEYVRPEGNYTISVAAFTKHHISPKMLQDKPTLRELADKIIEFFDDCDICTYNGNSFDIPFLCTEFERIGKKIDFMSRDCYDVMQEELRRHSNKLASVYQRYRGKTMEEAGLTAHDAFSDIKATYSIFVAQQRQQPYGAEHMYGEDGFIRDIRFCGVIKPCFTHGKYREVSLEYVALHDQDYLRWCVGQSSQFSESTKQYIRENYIK